MIETERLILRPLTLDDAPEFVRLFEGDWEAVKQTGRLPYPPAEPTVRAWLKLHEGRHSHGFGVIQKASREFMGLVGYGGDVSTAEVGYALGRAHWGQGYATEAVKATNLHAQANGLVWIEAFSFIENPASARVLEKAGFTELGTLIKGYPKRGGPRRVRQFRLRFKDEPRRWGRERR